MDKPTSYSERYSRQLGLPGFGESGQRRLSEASVLVAGAGGLGAPALLYLAAAGVGRIGIADGDLVSLSNLQRQVIYTTDDVGKPKVGCAAERLHALNPDVDLQIYPLYIDRSNALDILQEYDLVIDATDTFEARYVLSDACELTGATLVQGSVSRFEGQLLIFRGEAGSRLGYRDLFPGPVSPGEVKSCAESGVLGVLPGILGTMQAAEAIKLICDLGKSPVNKLMTFDLLANQWNTFALPASTRSPMTSAAFYAFGEEAAGSSACGPYTDISDAEFDRLIARSDVTVIDVREPGEHPVITTFPAINIPIAELPARAHQFVGRTLVVFCHAGIRSLPAAELLGGANTVYHLKGGIVKWLRRNPTHVVS